MRDVVSTASSVVMAAAAIILTVSTIRDRDPVRRTSGPRFETKWQLALPEGIVIGNRRAPVKLVEFADLECPACARFDERLVAARKRFGDSLALVFVHNPLTIHKYAAQAAAAAECADAQGSFAEFVSAVYRRQDSLGHKSWNSYAKDAGVQDTARFTECLQSEPAVRISRGIAISKALNVQATPTIFINGWRFSGAPNSEALEEAIRRALLREPLGSSSGWFEKLRSTRSVRGD